MQRLVPRPVAETSRLWPVTKVPHAMAGFSVFVGLDAPIEKIRGEGDSRISAKNWWIFASNDITKVGHYGMVMWDAVLCRIQWLGLNCCTYPDDIL